MRGVNITIACLLLLQEAVVVIQKSRLVRWHSDSGCLTRRIIPQFRSPVLQESAASAKEAKLQGAREKTDGYPQILPIPLPKMLGRFLIRIAAGSALFMAWTRLLAIL